MEHTYGYNQFAGFLPVVQRRYIVGITGEMLEAMKAVTDRKPPASDARIIVHEPETKRGRPPPKVEIIYNNIGAVDRFALIGLGAKN